MATLSLFLSYLRSNSFKYRPNSMDIPDTISTNDSSKIYCPFDSVFSRTIDEKFNSIQFGVEKLQAMIKNFKFPKDSENIFSISNSVWTKSNGIYTEENLQVLDKDLLESPENAPTLTEQIKISINLHYNPKRNLPVRNKRGRPEDVKDCTVLALEDLMLKWESELISRLKRDQRSDAFFASVGRYIKKIPDLFLKYIGSKCQYKSRNIRTVLRSYLKCFMSGFLPMFPLPDKSQNFKGFINVFLDFCILSFPDAKIRKLITIMKDEEAITVDQCIAKLHCCRIRIKASKMSYKALYDSNSCFQLICGTLKRHFKQLEGINERKIHGVLDFLNSKNNKL